MRLPVDSQPGWQSRKLSVQDSVVLVLPMLVRRNSRTSIAVLSKAAVRCSEQERKRGDSTAGSPRVISTYMLAMRVASDTVMAVPAAGQLRQLVSHNSAQQSAAPHSHASSASLTYDMI